MLLRPVDASGDILPVLSSSILASGSPVVVQLVRDRLNLLSGEWWEKPAWGFDVLEMTAMGESDHRMAYMVEAEDIATSPDPDYAATGSIAFTAEMTGFWVKTADGTRTESASDALALIGLV